MKNVYYRKPLLFEKSTCNIWTDPYIQQRMLKEHLSQETDGASRNADSIRKTVDFITGFVAPSSHILDLGCGPGLYATILYEKGYRVTGVDFNQASIEYAISQNRDVQYIHGDYLLHYPEGLFDAVIMIYCDMGTHSDEDRDKLLKSVYDSLPVGGHFIFDVFTDRLMEERQESRSWSYEPDGGFWSEREYLLLSETFHYPEAKAFATQYNLLVENETSHFILWDRYYSPEEVSEVVKRIGFSKAEVYHNITEGNNFTSAQEMFVVATK